MINKYVFINEVQISAKGLKDKNVYVVQTPKNDRFCHTILRNTSSNGKGC